MNNRPAAARTAEDTQVEDAESLGLEIPTEEFEQLNLELEEIALRVMVLILGGHALRRSFKTQ